MTYRVPGRGNGNPPQYSCRENPMDRGAWQATVHGVAKSQTWLSMHPCTHTTYCIHQPALEMFCIRTGTRHRKVSCMSDALWGEVSSVSEKGNQPSRYWSAEPLPWGWGLASANTGFSHFCSGWSLVSLPVDSGPCHMNSFGQGRYVSSHKGTQRFYFMLKYLCIHLTELSLNCSMQGL